MKDTLVKILLSVIGGAITINCLLYGLVYKDLSNVKDTAHQIELNIVQIQGQLDYLKATTKNIPATEITGEKFFEILEIIKTWNVKLDNIKKLEK